ncbi:MAG: alpha-glucosidase/alpha-galactosidase [Clostridia bacterium]|nr:alpha-glucosidase/alpha-galactosidase [Clostridia bacterium]
MKNLLKDVKNLKIAYIGGGSRGWARTLMTDLAKEPDIAGTVSMYDIDFEAAADNAKVGNRVTAREDVVGKWNYVAVKTIGEALTGADFVVLSIQPGTFDEMEVDVHLPEKYGIYQSVGDTVGPGGVVRSLRTIPIYAQFALDIKKYCPDAWVINFTNPMTVCVRTLYKVFPEIKAFGCCHEVFGTQKMFAGLLKDKFGMEINREDVKFNVLGVNHFTWVDEVKYKGVDLMPLLREAIVENPNGMRHFDQNWANRTFKNSYMVLSDLFKKYGIIPAAGDRHIAEFVPGNWYLKDPATVEKFGFTLTTVDWRRERLAKQNQTTARLASGEEQMVFKNTGEESVRQIKALLGMGEFVTNVNIPNYGQMEGLPLGAVVETNAFFSGDSIRPIYAGKLPNEVEALVTRVVHNQETIVEAGLNGDYELAFKAFQNDANMNLDPVQARELYDEMLEKTSKYLPAYDEYVKSRKN